MVTIPSRQYALLAQFVRIVMCKSCLIVYDSAPGTGILGAPTRKSWQRSCIVRARQRGLSVADVKDAKVGDKIKRLRSFRGMTCAELADAIGCTRPYLSAVENGRYPASTKILRKLQQALAVASDYFTSDEDPRTADTNRYLRSDTGTFAAGPGGTRVIPFVTLSAGGESSVDFDEVPSGNTDTIECPGDIEDLQAFAVRVDGDDMSPLIPAGAMAFVAPSKALKEGKPVLLRLNSGEMICRMYQARGGQVILAPANLAKSVRLVDATDVDWIYPVVRVMIDLYNDPVQQIH